MTNTNATETNATVPACPRCGRPSRGRAFGPSPDYLRCGNGHVFAR